MALSKCHVTINSSATANSVNGGGFNPANANLITDGACDTDTGNTASPVFSSATYTFVAGDVNAWVWIISSSNWFVGKYKIASVSGGKATLDASIGAASVYNSTTGRYVPNTVVGCASVGTPTSGTFGVDYSQSTAAILTATDYAATGSSTTLTSVTGGFTRAMVGNHYHQTTTGTGGYGVVGWYEIVNYTDTNTVTLDRTPNNGTASVACTGYTGGALSLNSTLDDDLFEAFGIPGGIFWLTGSLLLGESATISAAGGTQDPVLLMGYGTVHGDSTVATITGGANILTPGANWNTEKLTITGTGTSTLSIANGNCQVKNCKIINQSATADRTALNVGNGDSFIWGCLCESYRGRGIVLNGSSAVLNCYIRSSNIGVFITIGSTPMLIGECIISGCVTAAIKSSVALTSSCNLNNNTLLGFITPTGIGIDLYTGTTDTKVTNSIITGFVTGINHSDTQYIGIDDYNNYFNNTTDCTNWFKGANDQALDPQFSSVSEVAGTAATYAGTTLTDAAADFSAVTNNSDVVYIVSGTGLTTAGIYLITGHTTTTITTSPDAGESSASDWVYRVLTGHNFAIGTNLKAVGYPGTFKGGLTVGYMDIGAVQRQEAGTSGYSGGKKTMDLFLKKNEAVEIKFSMTDSSTPANLKSGLSVTDDAYYRDGAGSWTALAITDTASEIGSTGLYTIELTAGEMNHDQIMIKLTGSGAVTETIVIHTYAVDVDDLVRSTTPANTLDVSATGEAGLNFDNIKTATSPTTLTNITIPVTTTVTNTVSADVVAISGDTTAADNSEAFFDGTGYAGTNNTIPTVTSVTNMVTANTIQISGDSVAADNMEADYDGTGYNKSASTVGTTTTVTNGVTVTTNNDKTGYTVSTVSDKTGYSLSSAGIQAIWDALTSALTTVGSVGKLLVDNINATISSRSSHSAADIWAVGTRTLTSFGTLVSDIWANATRSLTDKAGFSISGTKTTLDALNDISTAQVNTEVDNALNTAIPTSPTLNSVNDRIIKTAISTTNTVSVLGHARGFSWPKEKRYYVDTVSGNNSNNGLEPSSPLLTYAAALALCVAYQHDSIILMNTTGAPLTIDGTFNINKAYVHLIGESDGITLKPSSSGSATVTLSAVGTHVEGLNIETATTGNDAAIRIDGTNHCSVHNVIVPYSRASAIVINNGTYNEIHDVQLESPGTGGNGHGIYVTGNSVHNDIRSFMIDGATGDGIRLTGTGVQHNTIRGGDTGSFVHDCTGYGIQETGGASYNHIVGPDLHFTNNALGEYLVSANTLVKNIEQWAKHSIATETRLAQLDAANIPTDIDNILVDTNELQSLGVKLSAQGKLDVNSEIDTALDTAIPGTPTTDSINERIKTIDDKLPSATYIMGSSVATGKDDEIDAIKTKTDNLPSGIKKNTALNNFMFVMVDSSDHITGKTGLTITCERSIDGATFAACANSATEIASGIYKINLAASDLNGDIIMFKFTATGADARLIEIKTQV